MSTSCEFQLERDSAVYYSGEKIKGKIILRTANNILVNAVLITLEGEAISEWAGYEIGGSKNHPDKQQLLVSRNKVFDGTNFLAGKHVYTISMFIPNHCPSTCEGRYGHISYEISVKLERPFMFDKVFRKHIIVYQPLDLNDHPEYLVPVKDENTRFLCLWPCRSGPILSSLVIPFCGYIPEQSISFSINIDNQSQYDIVGIEVLFLQHFIFVPLKPINRKCFTKTLARTLINKSTLRQSKRIYKASIVVPPATQRTTLRNNYLVSLHYELQVRLKMGLLHSDIVMSIPIVIGTVPLERHGVNTLVTMQPTASTGENRNQCDTIEIPSCSFADSNILQNIDSSRHNTNERQPINIKLPQFPEYDSFACRTQAENSANNPDWD